MTADEHIFTRTAPLFTPDGLKRIQNSHILIFGLGGVGSAVTEALARSGAGALTLVDHDTVSPSNLNRQLLATEEVIGQKKTEVERRRLQSINHSIKIETRDLFYLPEHSSLFDFSRYDFIVDAIDLVPGKISIIEKSMEADRPVISAMGTGNRLDPSCLYITDLAKTSGCPLARKMRYELKKKEIRHLPVLTSTEKPVQRDRSVASSPFVPPAAGFLIASFVVRRLADV